PADGDAAAGERFFFGAGNCGGCHIVGGRGRAFGPDLSSLAAERTTEQIERALRSPAGNRSVSVRLKDGRVLRGLLRNESNYDLQLHEQSGGLRLLSRDEIAGITREKSPMPPVAPSSDLMAYLTRLSGVEPKTAAPRPDSGSL